MKLNKIALGVALGVAGMGANAADTVFYPYVADGDSVTTIVNVIDNSGAGTLRYNASGVTGTGPANQRLHWRYNYKAGANATNNDSTCQELDFYLPSSPQDLQTVDLGGNFGSTTSGVLFNDPSGNNNWAGTLGALSYAMAASAGNASRGVLFVHNADANNGQTMAGNAMVFEFANGAAWGYAPLTQDNGGVNNATGFDFGAQTTAAVRPIAFMPLADVTTRFFVTPLDREVGDDTNCDAANTACALNVNGAAATPTPLTMLGANGASVAGWDRLTTRVGLATGVGVAYDRDENLVSGSLTDNVTCVGAVDAPAMMTSGAATILADGGYGNLNITNPGAAAGRANTVNAHIVQLDFAPAGNDFDDGTVSGTFNNGFRL